MSVADLMDPPPPYSHGQNVTTSSPQSGYHQQYRSYHSITRSSPRSEHYHQYSSRYIVTTSAGSGHHAHDQYGHSSSHEGTSLLRPTSKKPFHIATKNLFILISAFVVLLLVFTAQNTGYLPTMVDEVPAEVKRQSYQRWQRELDEHKVEVGTRLAQLVELEQERWEAMQEFEEQRKAYERERERWAEERRRWAEERRRWEQERQEEERHRKEVERRRQGVHWSGPWKNGGCVAYGVQSYSANLLDIPQDLNWREVCEDMPIQIEGRWYDRPNKCEANDHGNVWATWFVNTNESQCITYWGNMEVKGCSPGRTGMRRYESRLMNLHRGDDWDKMCNTSPATIYGVHYDRPTVCENKRGRTGIFNYPDPRCW